MAGDFERMLGILKRSRVRFSYDHRTQEWISVGCITFLFDGHGALNAIASSCTDENVVKPL